MKSVLTHRPWCLEMGEGPGLTLILPRMDTAAITVEEWQQILRPFWQDSRFLILDMPELLVQEQDEDLVFTVRELANDVHRYLKQHDLVPQAIWGFSLGGMIAQELSVLEGMQDIPLLLISTNAYADSTLQAVFSSWALMTEAFGEQGFELSLIPWISQTGELPILSGFVPPALPSVSNSIAIRKAKASLHAVSLHDARERLPLIQAPAMVLFGEHSVLLHQTHAQVFEQYLKHGQVEFIENAGMRILADNPDTVISRIKSYIGANV